MICYKYKDKKQTDDVEIYINGEKANVYETYVSKDPINRRWPGHQREEAQREVAYFVSCESSENIDVLVKTQKTINLATIRPISKNVIPNIIDKNTLSFSVSKYGAYSIEINDERNAIHLFFNKPLEYEFNQNEEIIKFENGSYDMGEIVLKDNQTIYIAEDAVVYANIVAENVSNIKIIGKGLLDNSKNKETILFEAKSSKEQVDVGNAIRKHFISLINCKNVIIDGIIMNDSLCYNVSALNTENLKVNNVKIIGCWRYNSDGIDLQNCRNCTITNCFIRTYDDCTCIKGDKSCGTDCYNVVVDNCVLWCDWGHALEIGYETCANVIKDVTYKNCSVIHTSFDFLNIGCVDYAEIYNVLYENIDLEFSGNEREPQYQENDFEEYKPNGKEHFPTLLSAGVFHHFEYSVGNKFGKIHHITYKDIRVHNAKKILMNFETNDENNPIKNVNIINLQVNGKTVKDFKEVNLNTKNVEDIVIS